MPSPSVTESPLSTPYAVSPADRAAYRRDGHVVLRQIVPAEEVSAAGRVLREAVAANNTESRPLAQRDLYGQAFLQTMNLWQVCNTAAGFILSQRFAGIAAQLLGVGRVRLYHDQALFKEPGGAFTPWHQDAGYWPLRGERCITMWLPLQDVGPEMGTLQFASGTNAAGPLSGEVISQASEDHFSALIVDGLLDSRFPVTEPAVLALGDASFHGGWTLHRALPNRSDLVRAVMTIIWFADGERVIARPGDHAAGDLATWLPGCRPGDVARSPLNPALG